MKNYKKGFAIPLVIIIALVIAGGGAYFYSKNKINKTELDQIQLSNNLKPQPESETQNKQTPTSDQVSLSITNNSYRESYLAGDKLSLIINVLKSDGRPATPDEGFNVQVTPYNSDTGQFVEMRNGEYYGGNASYQNDVWTFTPLETLVAGKYFYNVTAYCSNSPKGCGAYESGNHSLQITKKYTFLVNPPAQMQIVSIVNAAPSAPQYIQNGPGQIFGSYKITINGPQATVLTETFHLKLPTIGREALRDVVLVDENGKIVAGPVTAVGTGYDNQFQKFTFTDISYQPGTHTYTIKGTIPATYGVGVGFQLTTSPASDWKIIFPSEPGTTADLSSSGTVMLNQVYVGG